jgi:hypothetical protein
MTTQQNIKQYKNILSQEWQYGVCFKQNILVKDFMLEKKHVIQDFGAALGWMLWFFF